MIYVNAERGSEPGSFSTMLLTDVTRSTKTKITLVIQEFEGIFSSTSALHSTCVCFSLSDKETSFALETEGKLDVGLFNINVVIQLIPRRC